MKFFTAHHSLDLAVTKLKIILVNPLFWLALFLYGLSFFIYTIVLSKMELSRAYPISSIGAIILILVISFLFLGESLSIYKILGIIICLVGIIILFH